MIFMSEASIIPTPRQRIDGAFKHRIYDRPPVFDVPNNPDLYQNVLKKDNFWSDPVICVELARKLCLDAVMIPCLNYSGMIKKGQNWKDDNHFIDRFGIEYVVTDSSWPLGFVAVERALDEDFLHELEAQVSVSDDEIDSIVSALSEAHTGGSDELAVFGGLRSSFSFLNVTAGLVAMSLLIYEDPELLHRFVKVSTDLWTEIGLKMIEKGVDALYVANDMGMNGSTLISPDHLREFFLPPFFEQCETWKKAGGRVILHSCGNINAILPDLYEADCIDALNNLQEKAGMDIADVKRQYGDHWTLIGNVDATSVMTSEDTCVIDTALEKLFDDLSPEGLIVATDHSFHSGIPIDNVLHFIDSARRMGLERCGGVT